MLANYTGHGGKEVWARERLLHAEDVPRLANSGKYPLVTTFSCNIGAFEEPEFEGLGELLVEAENRGAIGVFAATGLTQIYPDNPLGSEFYKAMFRQSAKTIGAATLAARLNYFTSNYVR